MTNIVKEFDSEFNVSKLKQNLKFFETNMENRNDVPYGIYNVEVVKLSLLKSQNGHPMVDVCFKICSGRFKKRLINTNYIVSNVFGLKVCNAFLKKISNRIIEFNSFEQYDKLLKNIMADVKNKCDFKLEYGTAKGFKTFKIQ